MPIVGYALDPDPWAKFRWLASMDERALWATLAAALVLAVWGAYVGHESRVRDA